MKIECTKCKYGDDVKCKHIPEALKSSKLQGRVCPIYSPKTIMYGGRKRKKGV